MSMQARQKLVDSLIFQDGIQATDIMDPSKTKTQLIALLLELVDKGWHLEVTAVKSDHHNDSALGEYCHYNGYCADVWPLNSATPGDYIDASSPKFQQFLRDAATSPWLHQIGLVGDGADSPENFAAAGPTAFQDDGGAHIHLGAQ
jgi:hypothetical protein